MAFVFRGIEPFVRSVVESAGRGHREHSMILRSEPVDRVGQALSQASLARPEDRSAVADGALMWREVLMLSLRVVEEAIVDTYAELGLPAPEFQSVRCSEPKAPVVETGPSSGTEPGEPPWVAQTNGGRSVVFADESEEVTRRKRR